MTTKVQAGAVGLAVLVAALMLGGTQEGQAQKKTQDVLVVNTAAEAVPVHVGTTISDPVWVRDAAGVPERFQAGTLVNIPEGQLLGTGTVTTVPAGKRLVIEYVSANFQLPSTQAVVELVLQSPPGTVSHYLTPIRTGVFGTHDLWSASQQLRLYADGGDQVLAALSRTGTTEAVSMSVSISGYLIDLP